MLRITNIEMSCDPIPHPVAGSLSEWLDGDWALVLSEPEHFAAHPSTPASFIAHEAGLLRDSCVKLLTVRSTPPELADLSQNRSFLISNVRSGCVVDAAEYALTAKLRELKKPFVLVLDAYGRCRSTYTYRADHLTRPRSIQDLLHMIEVLRTEQAYVSRPRHAFTAMPTTRPCVLRCSS